MTSNNINEKNHVYHALCTRITHKVLSEKKTKEMSAKESLDMVNEMKKNPTKIRLSERNRNPKTALEIYNKFEEEFHFVEKYGEIEFPNDDYSTRCEKFYQDALKEAVFRLGEMTRRKKNSLKINNKFYREYNNYNHYVTVYKEEKNLTFEYVEDPKIFEENEHGYKITKFECAFIIDEILSTGEQISNDKIYKELENIFKIKESKIYSDICKQAILKIKKTLKDKGVDENILNVKELPGNKNAYRYDTEIGFSAFKACNYKSKEKNIAEFKEMATKLLGMDISAKDIFPKDIDERVQYLINILIQAKEDGRKQNFQTHIERLSKLKEERPKDWTRTYLDLLKNMKDEFKSLSSTVLYADLLIEYADFILHYKIPEGYLPPDADIKNSVKKMYIKAIAKAKKHNDESRLIHYLVKYGEFLYSTEQHQTLHDVCCEAIELCESITGQKDIDREYAAVLHLYGRNLCASEDYTEAENYYRKALDIRSRLAGYNKETLNEIHTSRNDLADQSALSDTVNCLGNLYTYMDRNKEAMILYEKSLTIRKKCARRRPELYKAQIASSYYNISDLYIKSQDYKKAKEFLNKAIDIERILVQKSPEVHSFSINYYLSLIRYADTCISCNNDYKMANETANEAVLAIKPLYEYNPKQYGKEYADALVCLFFSSKLDDVYLNNALEALSIYKKSNLNQSSNDKIAAINTLIADAYISKGKRDEAEKHSHEALDSLRIINTEKTSFKLHLDIIVMVMLQTESYDDCKAFADKAIIIMNRLCAEINNLQHYKIGIYNAQKEIAHVYRRVHEYDKAIAIYKELEDCYRERVDNTDEYASLLYKIAICYDGIGEKEKYKEYLHSSIREYESLQEGDHTIKTEIARCTLLLAYAICIEERYSESYPLYEKVISLLNDSYKSSPEIVATDLIIAHGYYALALEETDKIKAFEHYHLSLKYFIEVPSDLENIEFVCSNLDRFILTSNLPKDTDKELIIDTIKLIKTCQEYGVEVYTIDTLEDLLNGQ